MASLTQQSGLYVPSLSFSPAPYFGMTQNEQDLASYVPSVAPAPFVMPGLGTPLTRDAQLAWLQKQTGGAVGSSNDPAQWTPEEAAAQTDRALARIAQVNPDLAKQLAAQHGKSAAEGEDLPWYKDILKGVGEVMHATKLDVVFDIIGRTSHIIPEVIHDWGKESVWTNVGQAIAGTGDSTWHDVLRDNFGMKDSFWTAAVGFVGDVLTDPLTYMTFGLGGMARAAVGKTVATATAKALLEEGAIRAGTESAVELGAMTSKLLSVMPKGSTIDDAARAIFGLTDAGQQLAERGGGGLIGRIRAALTKVHPDAQAGAFFTMASESEREAMLQTLRVMDDTYRAATTVGWQRVTEKAAAKLGVDKKLVDQTLKAYVAQGTGVGVKKVAYEQGKAAAASLGGARLRFSIPVLDIRAAGMKIPLWPSRMDFSMGRRFFAGLSGQTRLMKMMGEGGATLEDMRIFWEGGFSELAKQSPRVAKDLGGPARSMLYATSEAVGGITKHLSPHAMQLRGGGLAAKYSGEVSQQARHIRNQTIDEMQTVTLADGAVLRPNQVADLVGKAVKNAGDRAGELGDALNELHNLVPVAGQSAGKYWENRISAYILRARQRGEEQTAETLDTIAAMRTQQEKALAAERRVHDLGGDERLIQVWGQVARNRDGIEVAAGLTPDTYSDAVTKANDLTVEDATQYSDGVLWESDQVGAADDIGATTLTDNGVTGVPLRGVRGRKVGKVGDPLDTPAEAMAGATRDVQAEQAARGGLSDAQEATAQEDFAKWLMDQTGETPETLAADAAKQAEAPPLSPVEQFMKNLDDATQRAVAEHTQGLAQLTPEEAQFVRRPRYVATGPRRTLTIDRRTVREAGTPSQASEVIDPVAEIQDTYRPILDDIAAGGAFPGVDDLPEDTVAELRRIVGTIEGKDAQLADITTEILRQRGYTDVRIVTDQGEELVSFYQHTTGVVPIARVNPRAARLADHGGNQLRAVTEAAREAVAGTDHRAGEKLIRDIMRAVKHKPREEAERIAQRMLAENGKQLRPHQSFFETDPLRIMEEASQATARKVQKQFVGESIRHAENLGLTRGGFGASPVGLGRYQVVLSEAGPEWAKQASAEVRAAQELVSRLADTEVPALRQAASDLNDQYQLASQAFEDLANYEPARLTSILQTIRRNTTGEARIASPEDVERKLGTFSKAMNSAFKDGVPSGYVKLGDAKSVPGVELWRVGNPDQLDQGLTYLAVERTAEGEARVVSMRKLGASITDNVERNVSAALTLSSHEGQGLGSELADLHWADLGITNGTPNEVYDKMARAISVQEFSQSGAGLATKYVTRRSKEILRQAKKDANKLKQSAERATRELDHAMVQQTEATNELNRLITRTQTDRAPVIAALKPLEDSLNLTGMTQLRVPGFEDFTMPTFMAEEFERAMSGYPKLDGAHLAFRQLNNFWKQFATWLNPGFHMRNIQGAFFNNWLGGVQLRDYVTSARIRYAERELASGKPAKWAKRLVSEADPDLAAALKFGNPTGYMQGVPIDQLTYADLASLTAGMNITASNGRAFAEAMLTAEEQTRRVAKAGKKGYLRRIPAPYTKVMRGAGTMTENVFRTAAFVRGMRDGRSLMESRAFTMMRHGDYEDMTDAEYLWVRDLIPFYKWMRTNTPFQIHQLLENPGRLLAVQKAQRAVYDVKGLDYEKEQHRMPEWMSEGFTIPYNVRDENGLTMFDTVMLDLPMSDLFMGGREFVASFLPTVRPFLESYVFHQQTFSGSPLSGKQVPLNPLLRPLAPVLDAVGLASKGADGGLYVSDRTQNLLGVVPLYSRFKNFIYGDPSSVSKRSNAVASAVFGIQLRPVDAEALTSEELNFYYDQVLPTVEYLRGVGYPLPTTQDLEHTVGTTNQILERLGITPGAPAGSLSTSSTGG